MKNPFVNPVADSLDIANSFSQNDGAYFATDQVRARDADGLKLYDDGGNGIFVKDAGKVGIGTASPSALLNLKGNLSSTLTGTVAVTNLSTAVVGTGTLFTTELAVGDSIKIGTEIFTVSVITNALNLTLDSAYQGATASGLTAYRDPTFFAIDNGDAVNKLIVTRSGNVGIGTAGPGEKLTISGGNISLTTANSKITGNTALTLEQTGDILGTIRLHIQNRSGVAGAILEQAGSVDLIDFIFKSLSNQRIIRFEDRAATTFAEDPEFQIGIAGNPTLVIGDNVSIFRKGNVGIGTATPDSRLDIQKAGTAKANLDILELTNSGNAADMDGTQTSILFNQWYYDATTPAVADAGRITVGAETDWTSVAATQDAYMSFKTALDGVITEQARVDSSVTAGQTRFLIYDVDNATLERVTVGAQDSGGLGFKLLRIAN